MRGGRKERSWTEGEGRKGRRRWVLETWLPIFEKEFFLLSLVYSFFHIIFNLFLSFFMLVWIYKKDIWASGKTSTFLLFLITLPFILYTKKKKKTFAPYFTHQLLFVSKRHEKYIHAQISFAFINLLCYSHSKNIESISSLVLHVSPIWRTFFFLFLFLHIYSQRHTSHLSFYFSYYFSKNNFFLAFFSVFWYAKWDWIDEK